MEIQHKLNKHSGILILVLILLVIRFLSGYPFLIQNLFTQNFYPFYSRLLRSFYGWIPISLGDILYAVAFLFLVYYFFQFFKTVKLLFTNRTFLKNWILKLAMLFCCTYIVFNISWGLNYNNTGVAAQLNLDTTAYTKNDLVELTEFLVNKVNQEKTQAISTVPFQNNFSDLGHEVKKSYGVLSGKIDMASYNFKSLKPSMWGWLGNYSGYTGYYNPFTGEAQVNTTVPKYEHAFIACHEVAHQLGYAKENEANFIGYLAAKSSDQAYVRYSADFALLVQAYRQLYRVDSTIAQSYYEKLSPFVLADIAERKAFNKAHRSFLQPVIMSVYDKFLLANEQPSGILSYDEVVGLVIAYKKKTGHY